LSSVDDFSDYLQQHPADVIRLRMMFQHNPDQMMNMLVGGADSIKDHINQAERFAQREQSAEDLVDTLLQPDDKMTAQEKILAKQMSVSFEKFVGKQKAALQ
jgi:leucyl-tRNA synthetase